MNASEIYAALSAPFAPGIVRSHAGRAGVTMNYVTARDVMDRLNEVVGLGGWRHTVRLEGNGTWVCRLEVRVGDEWIWHEDASDESDIEEIKGGASGCFKRAAVHFGVGRYLYPAASGAQVSRTPPAPAAHAPAPVQTQAHAPSDGREMSPPWLDERMPMPGKSFKDKNYTWRQFMDSDFSQGGRAGYLKWVAEKYEPRNPAYADADARLKERARWCLDNMARVQTITHLEEEGAPF